jgi:hypothetical protein
LRTDSQVFTAAASTKKHFAVGDDDLGQHTGVGERPTAGRRYLRQHRQDLIFARRHDRNVPCRELARLRRQHRLEVAAVNAAQAQ